VDFSVTVLNSLLEFALVKLPIWVSFFAVAVLDIEIEVSLVQNPAVVIIAT
jgi:hypothetical protein